MILRSGFLDEKELQELQRRYWMCGCELQLMHRIQDIIRGTREIAHRSREMQPWKHFWIEE